MMMEELKSLTEKLSPFVETIEIKGSDEAEFLYVTGNGKSVEISLDGGNYWVEYWARLDEDAEAVCENTFETMEDAEKSVKEWLG